MRSLSIGLILIPALGSSLSAAADTFADPNNWIRYEIGDTPLIISVGHGGGKTPKEWTARSNPDINTAKDSYTWPLSKRMWEHLQWDHGIRAYWILNTVHRRYADVNRAPGGKAYESPEGKAVYEAFHNALNKAVEETVDRFGFALVVDIHGQSKHPADVYLGTGRRKSMDDMLRRFGEDVLLGPKSLQELLAAKQYSVPANVRPPGPYKVPGTVSGGYITHHYGRRVHVDAVQVEVHGRLRKDETTLPGFEQDLASAIADFHGAHVLKMLE